MPTKKARPLKNVRRDEIFYTPFLSKKDKQYFINTSLSKDMKVLVFDTETTGLPPGKRDYDMIQTILRGEYEGEWWNEWPHIVQLSWILYDFQSHTVEEVCDRLIRVPDGVKIPIEATRVHGISTKRSREEGLDASKVFAEFRESLNRSNTIVAHNINFDVPMTIANFMRYGIEYKDIFNASHALYCTMKEGKYVTRIGKYTREGKPYFKSPKLSELYTALYKREANEEALHDSMNDVYLCLCCFCKMEASLDITEINENMRDIMERITVEA